MTLEDTFRGQNTEVKSRPDTDQLATLHLWELEDEIRDTLVMREDEEDFDESYFESLNLAFDKKVEACAIVADELKTEIEILQNKKKKIDARIKYMKKNRVGLLEYVKGVFIRLKIVRSGHGAHRIRIQKNPLSVEVPDEDLDKLPEIFRKVTVEARKAEIIRHVKNTGEIPDGVKLVYGSHARVY